MMTHKKTPRARYDVDMRRLTAIITLFLILIVSPAHAQSALGPGMWDENVPQIVFSGVTWSRTVDSLNYGGYRMVTGQTTSTAPRIDFKVWGSGFTIYIVRNSVGADTNICINGVCQSLSFYSAAGVYTTVTYSGLGWGDDGIHDVYIQKSNADNENILFDALYVAPHTSFPTSVMPTPIVVVTVNYPTPQPTPTGTQYAYIGNWDDMPPAEFTDDPSIARFDVSDSEGNPRAVLFNYAVDAGQILTVMFSAGSLVMLVIIMILLARRQS